VYLPGGYYGYPWWSYGGLGLGYTYYDPWAWGNRYGYGYGYGYPYGSYPPPAYGGSYSYGYEGALRVKVKPPDAMVVVDGYYVGIVDDFDGIFQRLYMEAGPHRIEVRLPGYETLAFDVRIDPGRTITYQGELNRLP